MSGVWCVAELRHGTLVPTLFELLTAGRALADGLGEPLAALILGGPGKARAAAEAAARRGPDRVYVLEHAALEGFREEAWARALGDLAAREKPAIVLFPASSAGRTLAARASVACGAALVSDATDLSLDGEKRLIAVRPCYGGNLLSTVALRGAIQMASVRPMAFGRAKESGKAAEITAAPVDPSSWNVRTTLAGYAPEASTEVDLSGAEKVVSGGRGLGNPEGFSLVRDLARALGAAVGASRATVDAGWIPYRHQVGLTGRTVRPKLYVACGISGQIQHLAGMSASEIVVALNTDAECPMMKLANFAVQGDVYELVPAILAEIQRQRGDAPVPAGGGSAA